MLAQLRDRLDRHAPWTHPPLVAALLLGYIRPSGDTTRPWCIGSVWLVRRRSLGLRLQVDADTFNRWSGDSLELRDDWFGALWMRILLDGETVIPTASDEPDIDFSGAAPA